MMTSDKAFFFPIAELSCGEVGQINEYNYVYNNETGVNDYEVDREYQYSLDVIIRQKKKYPCSKIYGSYKSRAEKNRAENYSMRN